MDPITARILSSVFGIGAGGPTSGAVTEGAGAGEDPFYGVSTEPPAPMNIPASVAPTAKAEGKLRTSHTMNSAYQRGGGSGMPTAPGAFDPNIVKTLMGQAPDLAAPMMASIHDQYAPIHQAIQGYGNLTPDQLPYVPPDPMAHGMQAAASMGLGRWGAALQGMPERGGEAAARIEKGIGAHQQGMDNVAAVKRETKRKQEEMSISALSAEVGDKLKAQDTAFTNSVNTYVAGKKYDSDLYGIAMDAWNSAEQRKVALQIAKWQNEGEHAKADMASDARSAISYASAEVAKQLIAQVKPEDMDITFPVPGAPGDPKNGIPPGYQSVHGLDQLDQRIISSVQSIEDPEVRNAMVIMYTNAISSPVYKYLHAKGEKENQKRLKDQQDLENIINSVGSGDPYLSQKKLKAK